MVEKQSFMRAEDVAKELGISVSHAYKIMQQLNKELKARGYMTIAGRVNRKFFIGWIKFPSCQLDFLSTASSQLWILWLVVDILSTTTLITLSYQVDKLYVDSKNVGPMVFPQRGADTWDLYGWSNPVKVYLKKGRHKIGLRYLNENININIDTDRAHLKSLRLVQLR